MPTPLALIMHANTAPSLLFPSHLSTVFGPTAQSVFTGTPSQESEPSKHALRQRRKRRRTNNVFTNTAELGSSAMSNPLPRHLFGLANQAFVKQEYQTAESAMLELLALDPDNADAHTLLAMVYEQTGEFAKSYAHDKTRLELGDVELTAERLCTCAHRARLGGKIEDSIALYRQALKMQPGDRYVGLALCDLYVCTKKYQLCIEQCRALLEVGGTLDLNILLMEARARVDMKDNKGALQLLLEVAKLVVAPVGEEGGEASSSAPRLQETDEEEIIAQGLSAVSGAADLLLEQKQPRAALDLILRCRKFLQTGKSSSAEMKWSWDLVKGAFKPRLVPLDLLVKHGMCALRLGMAREAQDLVSVACKALSKVPLSLSRMGEYEELHGVLARELVKAGEFELALGLLRRLDLVEPARQTFADIFASALEATGRKSEARDVRQREAGSGHASEVASQQSSRVLVAVMLPPQHDADEAAAYEELWNSMHTPGFLNQAVWLLTHSLDFDTLELVSCSERLPPPSWCHVITLRARLGNERAEVLLAEFAGAMEARYSARDAARAMRALGGVESRLS